MSVACRAEVELQTARETEDYRMDSMLMSQCEADVSKSCAGVEDGEEGHGLVLKCLVDNHKDLSASCQTEVREEGQRDGTGGLARAGLRHSAVDAGVRASLRSHCVRRLDTLTGEPPW